MGIIQLKSLLRAQDRHWIIGYIAAILLPFGLIFNRGFAEVCVATICLLFLFNSFVSKKFNWLHCPITKIAFMAWAWLLFISLFAKNIPLSFEMAVPWIRCILLFLAFKNWILVREDTINFLCKTLTVMVILVVIDTLWQYVYGVSLSGNIRDESGRLTGPLDNVKVGIFLAKMVLPTVGICLFFSSIRNSKLGIITNIFLLIITIATILLTGERTAFASVTISVFTGILLLAICEAKFRKILFFGTILIVFTFIALIRTQVWVEERASQFYDTIANYPSTEYGQLQKAGIIIGKDNVLTGAGLNSFRNLCPKLLEKGYITTCNIHPHNLYIEWFAGAGIIGLLIFISLVIFLFIQPKKQFLARRGTERLLPLIVLCSLIVNFFAFMPTQSIFSNWPAILLWYSVSVAMAAMNVLNKNNNGT